MTGAERRALRAKIDERRRAATGKPPRKPEPVVIEVDRDSDKWLRIRAQIGPCSMEVDADEHADLVYRTTMELERKPRFITHAETVPGTAVTA